MKKTYRHIGYYNDIEVIKILKTKTPSEIVDCFKNNCCSNFYATSEFRDMTEEEIRNIIGNEFGVEVYKVGEYIITLDTQPAVNDKYIDFWVENN